MAFDRLGRTGILFALFSAALFGASTPLAKVLLGSVSPWMMAGLLYLGAGVGLCVIHFSRRALSLPKVEAPLRRSDLPWLGLVIGTGGVLGPILLMFGLIRTPASGASLLLNVEGLATMTIAWVIFRENVDRRLLMGAAAILIGALLLSWQGETSFNWGALLIAGACLCWGIDNNLTRKLSSADPVQIALIKDSVAGTVNTVLALSQASSLAHVGTLAVVGLVGLIGYGVSLVFFVVALRNLGTARTGAYFSVAPFVGALLSIIFLHDPVSPRFFVAGTLMALGLWFHISERHEHEHTHEALEHEHKHVHDEHHQHQHSADVPSGDPHSHAHRHQPLIHTHPHYPDLHHRHKS